MKLNLLLLSVAALVNAATGVGVSLEADADTDDDLPIGTTPTIGTPVYAETVELGTAGNYVILTKTGISTVPESDITGDVGVSPIAGSAMTGFSLVLDSGGQFSTSEQINGKAYGADYAAPTPSELTAAVNDMETAYTDAAGRPNEDPERKNVGGGDISGEILKPGVYTFDVEIRFSSDIAFEGGPDDVFILQTAQNFWQGVGTKVHLYGGAQAKNIFWQIAANVSVGADAELEGVLLVKTDVVFVTGSSLNGRVLAQTACNLQMATITEAKVDPISIP
jgi:hypothetical protein